MWRVTRRMSSTDESLSAGGGESSPADSIHVEDGAAKTISEERRGEELMIQLKRIKSESVVQQIIDSLVEAMIRKELKPGDQIPTEMELAERLGVGRNSSSARSRTKRSRSAERTGSTRW